MIFWLQFENMNICKSGTNPFSPIKEKKSHNFIEIKFNTNDAICLQLNDNISCNNKILSNKSKSQYPI